MAEDAPRLHPKGNLLSETLMKRGNVDQAIAEAKHVVTQHYSTPRQEHAFLEPESALAVPAEDRSLTVYTGGQGVYDDHRGIVEMLGVAGRQGPRHQQACGRRIRRQGRSLGAASRRSAGLAQRAPGQTYLQPRRKFSRTSQAPPDGDGLHHRVRCERQDHRGESAHCCRYGRVRVTRRAGVAARLHPRSRTVPDRQCRYRGPRNLHQQHSFTARFAALE